VLNRIMTEKKENCLKRRYFASGISPVPDIARTTIVSSVDVLAAYANEDKTMIHHFSKGCAGIMYDGGRSLPDQDSPTSFFFRRMSSISSAA